MSSTRRNSLKVTSVAALIARAHQSGHAAVFLLVCLATVLGPVKCAYPQLADTPAEAVARPAGDTRFDQVAGVQSSDAAANPRALLRALRVEDSHFQRFLDGQSIGAPDRESLCRVLLRLPDFPLLKIEQWAEASPAWLKLFEQPDNARGDIFLLRGEVRRVSVERPEPELAERFGIEQYYRCDMTLPEGHVAAIYTSQVPKAWKLDEPVRHRASARGFFLKKGPPAGERAELIFAARNVAWHPPTPLGDLQMDYGLWDAVRHGKPIEAVEAEAFYQLLLAAARSEPRQLLEAPAQKGSVPQLLAEPAKHQGHLFSFSGIARRAVKVRIVEPELQSRLGLDHYYEVMLMVDLEGVAEIGGQQVTSYPVTLCLCELPAGMPTGQKISEPMRAAGFFFKTWAYESKLAPALPGKRQVSPLLIGRDVQWQTASSPARNHWFGFVAAGIFLVALIAFWIGIWRHRGTDGHLRRLTRGRAPTIPPDGADAKSSDKPDFSNL